MDKNQGYAILKAVMLENGVPKEQDIQIILNN